MKIVIIDNYDSFTYNLVHAVNNIIGSKIDVFRNDEVKLEDLEKYDKIILSPGPGIPSEAGLLMDIIKKYSGKKSMLGVCLGHQAICEAFGAKLVNMQEVKHGIASKMEICDTNNVLYKNLPKQIDVGHYHSWMVDRESMPSCFEITGLDGDGLVMSVSHKELNIHGVQYHPESVLTPHGIQILKNWINS